MTSVYAEPQLDNEGSQSASSQLSHGPKPEPFPGARLLGRFSLLLPAFLAAIYLALWAFYPWRPLAELDSPGWIVDFADQVDMMMTARNPRIVVLGSSLILAAPRRLRRPAVFEQEFSQAAGHQIQTACMAVPGAITSDQDFILEQLLTHHKKPALVVYTYAARDFMDNTIEGKITATPTRRVLTFIDRRTSFLPRALTPQAFCDCYDNHVAFIDLVRRHVLHMARSQACRLTGHPESLWSAATLKANGTASSVKSKQVLAAPKEGQSTVDADEDPAAQQAALAKDLELYQRRYNPLNQKRRDEQYAHLENLLKIARDNKIQVALVGMPLSPANLKLLPGNTYQNLASQVATLASKYGASCVDLNESVFEQGQFLDSAHLSTPGARAFMPIFVKSVVGSKAFKDAALGPQ